MTTISAPRQILQEVQKVKVQQKKINTMMKLSVIVQNVYLKIQPQEIIQSTDTDLNLIIIMKYKTIITSSKDKVNRNWLFKNK